MQRYRAGVIGLGWMGLLYDLAERVRDRFDVDDTDRPTPVLDVHRKFHHYDHPGNEGMPNSYSEALSDRPEIELVAGADRDAKRLEAFSERYGVQAVYTDATAMLRTEHLDIVAICTNTKSRAELTCLAVECGAKGIVTEKPMAHTLQEADRMVSSCAAARVALCCGAISTTHPSFGRAKELVRSGAIGDILSVEAGSVTAQHQNWSYFVDSAPAWAVGIGDQPRRETGSDEFRGQGIMATVDGLVVHFRNGAPGVRVTGSSGEVTFDWPHGWRLWQDIGGPAGKGRVKMPWPEPQFVPPYGSVYAVREVMDCLAGTLDEPKNSGRRVAIALEVEIALKLSSLQGGSRIDLPLADRSLSLNYDWYR